MRVHCEVIRSSTRAVRRFEIVGSSQALLAMTELYRAAYLPNVVPAWCAIAHGAGTHNHMTGFGEDRGPGNVQPISATSLNIFANILRLSGPKTAQT